MIYKDYTIDNIFTISEITKADIKNFNAFFTPKSEAYELIKLSGIKYNNNKIIDILEPTAGIGNLIVPLLDETIKNRKNFKIDCYEMIDTFYYIGKTIFEKIPNIKWYLGNSYSYDFNKKYDYIFTNPPFNIIDFNNTKNTLNDVDFLNKYYNLLKKDGLLCGIISVSYKTNNRPKYKKFRDNIQKLKNLDDNNVSIYEISGFKKDETITKEMELKINMVMIFIKKIENFSLL